MPVPKKGSYLKKLSNNKDGMEQAHQYGRSKALLLYFARELSERAAAVAAKTDRKTRGKGSGIGKVTINSADPGSAWTPLTNPNQAKLIPRLIMNLGARDPLICATALVNGVSVTEAGNGKIMQDFDMAELVSTLNLFSSKANGNINCSLLTLILTRYPPFMNRKSGRIAQARVWDEAREEFEAKVPEVKAVYKMLDA